MASARQLRRRDVAGNLGNAPEEFANRHEPTATWTETTPEGRWRSLEYDELLKGDKLNLDIFWFKDKSLEDSENLHDPDVLAQEIIDDLEDALAQLRSVASELR